MDISTAQRALAANILADARALLGTPAAFGDRKVFLSEVFGPIAGQDMADVDALRCAGLLTFARADLVQAMDPEMVAASHWAVDKYCDFHFLVVQ